MTITRAVLISGCLIGTSSALSSAQGSRTVSSGVYTADQAKRGEAAYQKSCSTCHLADLRGDQFATPLVGETFSQRWQGSNIGELFALMQGTMPADSPGSLPGKTYADIAAYLLLMNKYPTGEAELGQDPGELARIAFKK